MQEAAKEKSLFGVLGIAVWETPIQVSSKECSKEEKESETYKDKKSQGCCLVRIMIDFYTSQRTFVLKESQVVLGQGSNKYLAGVVDDFIRSVG